MPARPVPFDTSDPTTRRFMKFPRGMSLNGRQPIPDQLYPVLRNMILTGRIAPGERIDEKAMAAELRVSRTPVREALRRLSDEHLVIVVAQSGTRAAPLDAQHVHEAFLIRRALETESARQAARLFDAHHASALETLVDRQQRSMDRRRFAEAIRIDDRFHATIAAVSGLHRLWQTVEIAKAQLDRCRHIMMPRVGEAETTLSHHRRIIRALSNGDPALAARAMADHLDKAYETTSRMLEERQSAQAPASTAAKAASGS